MADDSIVVTVQFDGFNANEPVEISGYVVQADGAYSDFYFETTVPSYPNLSGGTRQVPVTIDNITGLSYPDKMMVVAKVAKVWPTVLEGGFTPETAGAKAMWKAQPAPPWGANW
jgi:hypothetical protein